MKAEAKLRLLEAGRAAAAQTAAILSAAAAGTLTQNELKLRLRAYVLAKLMLEEGEAGSLELAELARQSLAKTLKLDRELVEAADRPATCDGADSVEMKQALLIAAMQRELGIKLDGYRAAFADSTDDLAELVWEALRPD